MPSRAVTHELALPRMPVALAQSGACASRRYPADLWSSRASTRREAAIRICRAACPVREQCAAWADSLPRLARLGALFGGEYTAASLWQAS